MCRLLRVRLLLRLVQPEVHQVQPHLRIVPWGRDMKCLKCAEGYFMQDGKCVTTCLKTMREKPVTRACTSTFKERCSPSCLTCSLNPDWCLSCNQTSALPVLDSSTGRCIPENQRLCGQGLSNMKVNCFYIENASLECKICSELCKTCEENPIRCT
jgi:hypothetical protein